MALDSEVLATGGTGENMLNYHSPTRTILLSVEDMITATKVLLAVTMAANALLIMVASDSSKRPSNQAVVDVAVVNLCDGVISAALCLVPVIKDKGKPWGNICTNCHMSHIGFIAILPIICFILSLIRHKVKSYFGCTDAEDKVLPRRRTKFVHVGVLVMVSVGLCLLASSILPLVFSSTNISIGTEICFPVMKSVLARGYLLFYGITPLVLTLSVCLRISQSTCATDELGEHLESRSRPHYITQAILLAVTHLLPWSFLVYSVSFHTSISQGTTFLLLLLTSLDTVGNVIIHSAAGSYRLEQGKHNHVSSQEALDSTNSWHMSWTKLSSKILVTTI